jgi:HlyD family secretion protein
MSGSEHKALNEQKRANGRRRPKRWVPYLGAALLFALITAGLWPRPIPVETASVAVGTLRATVNEEGKTRIKQRYVVSAPVTGQLKRIPFKAGADVIAEQTVVAMLEPLSPTLLDPRTRAAAEARRDAAAANVEKARTAHTFAASELRRFEKLFSEKTISVQEREAAQMREASAAKEQAANEGTLRQAEAELKVFSAWSNADTNSTCPLTEIKAPVTGKVLRVFEENAKAVTAGTPLLEIGDPSDLEVVIEVLSRDGAVIPPGTPVDFEQWGGGTPLTGRVRLVEPAAFTKVSALGVEEQRVRVIADLTTPLEQRRSVGDNFRVEAKILVWEAADALKLPVGALFRQEDKWAAFVIEDGRAQLRRVNTGRSSGTETQVLDGLKSGEKVILYPGSRVRAGQRVSEIKI